MLLNDDLIQSESDGEGGGGGMKSSSPALPHLSLAGSDPNLMMKKSLVQSSSVKMLKSGGNWQKDCQATAAARDFITKK